MKLTADELRFIGECFLRDININYRLEEHKETKQNIISLTQLLSRSAAKKVVYTAFDGDHFHLLDEMRKCVLRHDRYPANPESILGYKNVVSRYQTKIGVLKDDLAIVKYCEEMWVFTDCDITPDGILQLPEGVLLEIVYFMHRKRNFPVKFIPINSLYDTTKNTCRDLEMKYEELAELLAQNERKEIIDLANNGFIVDPELKKLAYYITDPLDFKYSEWLRDYSRSDENEIALVPGLASKISDANSTIEYVGNIIMSWAGLMAKLPRIAYYLDSFDKRRTTSVILESLKQYFIQCHNIEFLTRKSWLQFEIPKCKLNGEWPLTQHEAKQLTICD